MRTRQWISVLALAGLAGVACAQSNAPVKVSKGAGNQVVLQFHGMRPAFVEIVVDGTLVATRTVQGHRAMLELTHAGLAPGTHTATIRLYDQQGRLIGEAQSHVEIQPDPYAPVSLIVPRNGARLSGTVPIEARLTTSAYVTFFVDGQVRALRNFAPYVYHWDTTREANGWHTLEVWSFDGKQTFKSPPTRVFVNNPGGRTERRIEPEPTETAEPSVSAVESSPAWGQSAMRTDIPTTGLPPTELRLSVPTNTIPTPAPAAEPTTRIALAPTEANPALRRPMDRTGQPTHQTRLTPPDTPANTLFVPTPAPNSFPQWRRAQAEPHMRGQKLLTPQRVAHTPPPPAPSPYENALMVFRQGVRLPHTIRSFDLVLNHTVVVSDVSPRVEDGIPLVTVRHALENAGAQVQWDNTHKRATITLNGQVLVLDVRANRATLNSAPVALDAPLQLVRGRIIVPVSLLGEVLNAEMLFDLSNRQLILAI
ncbi:MAG: hypothetical protein C4336_02225 [Armatimonadota bacterium]